MPRGGCSTRRSIWRWSRPCGTEGGSRSRRVDRRRRRRCSLRWPGSRTALPRRPISANEPPAGHEVSGRAHRRSSRRRRCRPAGLYRSVGSGSGSGQPAARGSYSCALSRTRAGLSLSGRRAPRHGCALARWAATRWGSTNHPPPTLIATAPGPLKAGFVTMCHRAHRCRAGRRRLGPSISTPLCSTTRHATLTSTSVNRHPPGHSAPTTPRAHRTHRNREPARCRARSANPRTGPPHRLHGIDRSGRPGPRTAASPRSRSG
jgi:hypothetical protein